jgi:hypothetical protein
MSSALVLLQQSLLGDAELERLRPGSTREWNPAAACRYVTGVQYGGADGQLGYHAVERPIADAMAGLSVSGLPAVARAACGELVHVSERHGTYDRMSGAMSSAPCRYCAWTVAAATGSTGRELALITPGRAQAAAIAGGGVNPRLAVAICQAILTASISPDADYETDHPATIQLLAQATRHRPVLLVPEDCAEDSCACARDADGDDVSDRHCSYPGATAACDGCTLQAGNWAGEWHGTAMPECTVPAPCSVLCALAHRYGISCC